MALTQHYFTNGTGRDTYISCDNGGFRPGLGDSRLPPSSGDLWSQFRRCPPARLRLPGISLDSRRHMASRQRQSVKRLATPKTAGGSPGTGPISFFPENSTTFRDSDFQPPPARTQSLNFPSKTANVGGPVFSKQLSKSESWSKPKKKNFRLEAEKLRKDFKANATKKAIPTFG